MLTIEQLLPRLACPPLPASFRVVSPTEAGDGAVTSVMLLRDSFLRWPLAVEPPPPPPPSSPVLKNPKLPFGLGAFCGWDVMDDPVAIDDRADKGEIMPPGKWELFTFLSGEAGRDASYEVLSLLVLSEG